MKFVFVSALFTAVLSMIAAPAQSQSSPADSAVQAALPNDAEAAAPLANECTDAGGVCRKSVCRGAEQSVPLECGHDLGCCLVR